MCSSDLYSLELYLLLVATCTRGCCKGSRHYLLKLERHVGTAQHTCPSKCFVVLSSCSLLAAGSIFCLEFAGLRPPVAGFDQACVFDNFVLQPTPNDSYDQLVKWNKLFNCGISPTLFFPRRLMSLISESWASVKSYLESLSLNSSIGRLMMSSVLIGIPIDRAFFSSLERCSSDLKFLITNPPKVNLLLYY